MTKNLTKNDELSKLKHNIMPHSAKINNFIANISTAMCMPLKRHIYIQYCDRFVIKIKDKIRGRLTYTKQYENQHTFSKTRHKANSI